MKSRTGLLFIFTFSLICLSNSMSGQGYKNPVISGFYPDPSVCKVGDDFYLVTSTFEYFPGVPIFHSKDLINWKQIGHCLTRREQLPLDKCYPSGGIYAPTIRYHEGVFYMTTTNLCSGGNFYVTTTDPAAEWSDPIYVKQGGIDPSIFFDDDGKVYYATEGREIMMSEIDIKTGNLLTTPRPIWQGTGGRYPEAPHIYKKDGYYYLLIAEGGTEYGHQITIARSRNIWGPYENNPANPILTHFKQSAQNNPIQGTGHGDMIQAQDGSWWMVYLAFRPQSGMHHLLGRETFLAPVQWEKNAWPVVNGNATTYIDMNCPTLPQVPAAKVDAREKFISNKLAIDWTYLRNPNSENYKLYPEKGILQLLGDDAKIDDILSPTFVGKRQKDIRFVVTASVKNVEISKNGRAGLSVFMNNNSHYDLSIYNNSGKYKLKLRSKLNKLDHVVKQIPLNEKQLHLRVEGTAELYKFYYSVDNENYIHLADLDTKYLSTETAGGFTGIFLALFAEEKGTKIDFDFFEYITIHQK